MASMNTVRHRRERPKLSEFLPGYVTIHDAAQQQGLSDSQMWRYVACGHLPAKNTPYGYAIREEDLKEFKPFPKGNPDFRTRKNPAKLRQKRAKKNGKK